MLKKFFFTLVVTSLIAQPIFAHESMSSHDKSCDAIAKACLDADFKRDGGGEGKQFWQDCMKPLMLGKKVNQVPVAKPIVIACRSAKIKELSEDLKELEKANNS